MLKSFIESKSSQSLKEKVCCVYMKKQQRTWNQRKERGLGSIGQRRSNYWVSVLLLIYYSCHLNYYRLLLRINAFRSYSIRHSMLLYNVRHINYS